MEFSLQSTGKLCEIAYKTAVLPYLFNGEFSILSKNHNQSISNYEKRKASALIWYNCKTQVFWIVALA